MQATRLSSTELETRLRYFSGTETWWRHPLWNFLYTDGVKFFAEEGGMNGAYWLLDWVGGNVKPKQDKFPFLTIKVVVKDDKAVIKVEDGDYRPVFEQALEFTDLQEGEWQLWFIDNTLLLPSEY